MIFWITLGVLVLGIIGLICLNILSDWYDVALGITVISGLALFLMLIDFGLNYIGLDAKIERCNVRYEILTYQYENNFYDNDNDVGKYELMQDIREWNEDLAAKKVAQHNFWYGIFVPDIYDQFEFIELK